LIKGEEVKAELQGKKKESKEREKI